jgi:hypothetical protein
MNDDFEPRLRGQRLRQIPSEWRREILGAANAVTSHHQSPVTRHSVFSILSQRLSDLLWPHPRAWAGLAVVWLVALTLNFATRDEPQTQAKRSNPPSAELRVALKQQGQLRAELLGLTESRDAARSKEADTSPRSQRRPLILCT